MVTTETLIEKCEMLRYSGIAEELKHLPPDFFTETTIYDALNHFLDIQLAEKKARQLARLRRQAKLRFTDIFLSDIDPKLYPSLKIRQLKQLATCDWLRHKQHLFLIGCTGVGKTSLACALAQEAIEQGFKVVFKRLSHLLLEMVAAKNEGRLKAHNDKYKKLDLLILDDWGNAFMDDLERQLLLDLVDSQDKSSSMLITSQYPVSTWHDAFQDSSVADSVLDRIVHIAHKIELKGESIRKIMGLQGGEL